MKLIAHLILFALLPFLSGCVSIVATQPANNHEVRRTLYDSADNIEKAGITKDNELCVFFEKHLTNSTTSEFAVVIPISQIRKNAAGVQGRLANQAYLRSTNYDKALVAVATLHMPGSAVRTNSTLLENLRAELKPVPVNAPSRLGPSAIAPLSSATETVFLTTRSPIEFAYIGPSIKWCQTIVKVDPYVISTRRIEHPGYYALLPLTIPVDIATAPIQIPVWLAFKYGQWHM